MIKEKTIFDIINDLTFNKVKWEDQEHKKVQPYMLNRWFSMDQNYLELIAECQPTTDLLSTREYYKFYLDLFPRKKFFTKYISGKNEKKPEYKNLIEFISTNVQISKNESEQMLETLLEMGDGRDKIKDWIKCYGYNDKRIKSEFGI